MSEAKIMIGISTREYGRRADFYDYVDNLDLSMLPVGNCMKAKVHEQSPARARNIIIEQALEYNCTHVLFLDDDMAFRPNLLSQLLEHDKDMVTGLYLNRRFPHQPLVFDHVLENGSVRGYFLNGNEERLVPVVAAGLGVVLVKIEVFKGMEKPWVRLGELCIDHWCDDIGFFNRARKAGFQLFCDTECLVGHIGSMILWPQKNKDGWFTGYDTSGDAIPAIAQPNPYIRIKNGIERAMEIEGWMNEKELSWLAEKARECKIIVEFGSHCGRSTRALGDNCTGIVYAVDPWDGSYKDKDDKEWNVLGGSRWPDFERNLKDLIDLGRVIPKRMKSEFFHCPESVDLLFIDSDHRYMEVITDIAFAKELVKEGGIIAGHDYGHPEWPDVKKAVDSVYGDRVKHLDTIWWVRNITQVT